MSKFDASAYSMLIFDFDGVFTDNYVLMDQNGIEYAKFSRADGYAINLLNSAKKLLMHSLEYFVLSTEKNPLVSERCKKMNLKCVQGVPDKLEYVNSMTKDGKEFDFKGLIYVGNDLNDLPLIKKSALTFCPADAHPIVKAETDYVSRRNGGEEFVREIVEILLGFESRKPEEIHELIHNC